jgi:hypothetical protein
MADTPKVEELVHVGSESRVPDPVVVRKLRWKMDLIILPLLVVMYTFK